MGGNRRAVHAAGAGPFESCPGKVDPVLAEVARQVAIGDRHDVTTMAAEAGQHREALARPPVRGLTRSGEGPVARQEARRSAARRDRGGQPSGPGPGCVMSLI